MARFVIHGEVDDNMDIDQPWWLTITVRDNIDIDQSWWFSIIVNDNIDINSNVDAYHLKSMCQWQPWYWPTLMVNHLVSMTTLILMNLNADDYLIQSEWIQ